MLRNLKDLTYYLIKIIFMTKLNYKEATNKKIVRNKLLPLYREFKKVVGLAGPDIDDYISNIKKELGNEVSIEIWENNNRILLIQLLNLSNPASIKIGDINNIIPQHSIFYDLDYCCRIHSVKNAVIKFKENFIMTFSIRGVGYIQTVKDFFKFRKEIILVHYEKDNMNYFITSNGTYIAVKYFDTSPMCCICKLPINY